jgi:hypothetical protein
MPVPPKFVHAPGPQSPPKPTGKGLPYHTQPREPLRASCNVRVPFTTRLALIRDGARITPLLPRRTPNLASPLRPNPVTEMFNRLLSLKRALSPKCALFVTVVGGRSPTKRRPKGWVPQGSIPLRVPSRTPCCHARESRGVKSSIEPLLFCYYRIGCLSSRDG